MRREQERGLLREPLVVDARLEVLLRRADVRLQVERAQRGRLELGRTGEREGEDGDEVRCEGDVRVRVARKVQDGADNVEVEWEGTRVANEPSGEMSTILVVEERNMLPCCTKGYLDERIDQRPELALLAAALQQRLLVACSRDHDGTEVDAVHLLPVVHLLVCVLQQPRLAATFGGNLVHSPWSSSSCNS